MNNPEDCMVGCFVCLFPLTNCGEHENQPAGATEFVGGGCYGSAITDTQTGGDFVVNICDKCLKAGIERGMVLRRARIRVIPSYTETYSKAKG